MPDGVGAVVTGVLFLAAHYTPHRLRSVVALRRRRDCDQKHRSEFRLPAYVQNISIGSHQLLADEPPRGGADAGPNQYELVMAGLGACTSMTVRMYAERRNWPLEKVQVQLKFSRIHAADCDDCSRKKGIVNRIEKRITLIGDLSEIKWERLLHVVIIALFIGSWPNY